MEMMSAILTEQGFRTQLDQYAVYRTINEGCSNAVAIARHKLTGADVAIKCIQKKKYARLQKEDRVSEAEALELCKESAYIVNLIEKFTLFGEIYLVTKFAAGGDLLQYCLNSEEKSIAAGKPGWLSADQVKHIFNQLALGLKDMHDFSLVHRDLKLLNVFLCDSSDMPRVKIGDLGLTVQLAPGETIVKKAGTIGFMAPEVVQQQPSGFKSDIYSLGIILYILFSTRLPFDTPCYEGDRILETINQEIPYEGPLWEQVDPLAIDLLKNMLVVDPA